MSDKKVMLSEFLKAGSIIRTKLFYSKKWVTNVVYSVSEEYMEINTGLEQEYIEEQVMIGDTIKCKYTHNDIEYIFNGWISRIETNSPHNVTIRVCELKYFTNIRDSYRYDVYLSAVLKKSANCADDGTLFSILTNMSRSGAALVSSERLSTIIDISGDITDCEVFCDIFISKDKKLTFEASIMREIKIERGFEYGVKIINTPLCI